MPFACLKSINKHQHTVPIVSQYHTTIKSCSSLKSVIYKHWWLPHLRAGLKFPPWFIIKVSSHKLHYTCVTNFIPVEFQTCAKLINYARIVKYIVYCAQKTLVVNFFTTIWQHHIFWQFKSYLLIVLSKYSEHRSISHVVFTYSIINGRIMHMGLEMWNLL